MKRKYAHRPRAIVIADTFRDAAPHLEDLKERGYEVELFLDPLDALAVFARSMPKLAVVAMSSSSPAHDLLMEDMMTYEVAIDLALDSQPHANRAGSC